MKKIAVLFVRVIVVYFFLNTAFMGISHNGVLHAQSNAPKKGFVTIREHEKLKQEMETLKKQMQTLLKKPPSSDSVANKPVSPATLSQANKDSSQSSAKTNTQTDRSAGLAEGDRKKEAVEAKRQLDTFLRSQKLLFKKGELQTELDLAYTKNNHRAPSCSSIPNPDPKGKPLLNCLPGQDNRSAGATAIARYGLLGNVEFDLTVPYSYVEQDTFGLEHQERTGLGDVGLGLRYAAWREDGTLPDIILNLNGTAPTGDNLLGNGSGTVGTSMTMVKTFDPVVLFGNLGYATTIGVSGSNQIPYSLGMGFSLNDRVSFSMSMAGSSTLNRSTGKISLPDSSGKLVDHSITVSSQDINTMQFSTTIQMKKNLSVEPFVSFGLTKESPDFAVGIRLPYRLDGKYPLPF
ncbi:MAG: transporter [Methyloglobulus sp.]|nr:transporter [Methyloglobulus sp.]